MWCQLRQFYQLCSAVVAVGLSAGTAFVAAAVVGCSRAGVVVVPVAAVVVAVVAAVPQVVVVVAVRMYWWRVQLVGR